MATLVVTIDTNKDPAEYTKAGQKTANGNRLIDLIKGLNYGALVGSIFVQGSSAAPVSASGTATLVSCATDTITIGKTTLTAGTDFVVTGTDAEDAANLAAAINLHATLSKIVSAAAAANVVTITALQKGEIGNYIALSETGSTITVSAAYLAGGTGGAGSVAEKIA